MSDRPTSRPRAPDLGIRIGLLPSGPHDAITDVEGVRVGHTTLISGEGQLRVGHGPVRTGVTVVVPPAEPGEAFYAGCHVLNGNGEMTGLEWVRESGLLTTPVAITNTHSVGVVRDAIVHREARRRPDPELHWALPVVGETWDGLLNDINGHHVRTEHLDAALEGATDGPVAEGNVGGGTGMVCHEFKGGIGSASRVVPASAGDYTVGALVQANHGRRERLTIAGVPVGQRIPVTDVPSPYGLARSSEPGTGSIIVVLATDAPLLPHQCSDLAQRAGLGIARAGGAGERSSGDIFLAFSTANRLPAQDTALTRQVTAVGDSVLSQLFWAAIEATEEAIVNALLAAETMVGRDGITAHALPHEVLRELREA
ncbi:MAG TPA: P1 family peptidase [Candidatus Limnocylindria bacterium]|nr:P1 family peptidase [Candidatus Limnocylindria bacterium]